MDYRAVKWKRNLNKIPKHIEASLARIKADLIVFAVTKQISPTNAFATYEHLSFPRDLNTISTLPPEDMGKYSYRNLHGWERRRDDLPMISKSYFWETPNFGDAGTYGTHIHHQDRDVYQREFHEARRYKINVDLLKQSSAPDQPNIYKFSLDHQLDRGHPNFSDELLFMLNILQENVGSVDVFASTATREEYLGTIHVDWQVFPPGSQDEVVAAMTKGRGFSPTEETVVAKRVALFSRLRPRAFLRGAGGLASYVGAQFADDLIVFENVKYGNALYILYADWEEVSQRSRLDIIKGTNAGYDRIVHSKGWEDSFRKILRREKWKRKIQD